MYLQVNQEGCVTQENQEDQESDSGEDETEVGEEVWSESKTIIQSSILPFRCNASSETERRQNTEKRHSMQNGMKIKEDVYNNQQMWSVRFSDKIDQNVIITYFIE